MESIDTVYLLQAARLGCVYYADEKVVEGVCSGIRRLQYQHRTLKDLMNNHFQTGSVLNITRIIPRIMFSTNPIVSHAGQSEEDVADMNNILFRYNPDSGSCDLVCDLSPKGKSAYDTDNASMLSSLEGVFAGRGLISLSNLVSFIKNYRPRWEKRPILIIDLGCKGNLEPPDLSDPELLFSPSHTNLARSESLDRDADVLERLSVPIPALSTNRLHEFDIWIMMAHSDRMHTQDPNAPMTPDRGLMDDSPQHTLEQSSSPESREDPFSRTPSPREDPFSRTPSPKEDPFSRTPSPKEGPFSPVDSFSHVAPLLPAGPSGPVSPTNSGSYFPILDPHDTGALGIDPYGTNVGNHRVKEYAERGSPYSRNGSRYGSRGGRSPRRRDVRRSKRKSVRRSRRRSVRRSRRRSVRKSRRRGVRASKRKTMRRSRRKSMRRSRRKSAR